MKKNNRNWKWIRSGENIYLQSDLLAMHNIKHGFFTKKSNNKSPKELIQLIKPGSSVHLLNQVHSGEIITVADTFNPHRRDGDCLISSNINQSVWVYTADCIPILFVDLKKGTVAACHAGWRGINERIPIKTVERLKDLGAHPDTILAALGPAISQKNYQVDLPVAQSIYNSIDHKSGCSMPNKVMKESIKNLIGKGICNQDKNPEKVLLDIRLATQEQLRIAGLADGQISICPFCTYENQELFCSWRRDKIKAIQWSGISS